MDLLPVFPSLFLESQYPVERAGGRTILKLWVPAEELDDFNAHIVGEIQLVHEFR
jgi:hypothetical protein